MYVNVIMMIPALSQKADVKLQRTNTTGSFVGELSCQDIIWYHQCTVNTTQKCYSIIFASYPAS